MPEKDGDEDKSTKSVVKKKQKQMMGEEQFSDKQRSDMKDILNKNFGSEDKSKETAGKLIKDKAKKDVERVQSGKQPNKSTPSTKLGRSSVNLNKYFGEEGYDHLRDQGRIRKTKDKKDATTMPPSKEMEKTRKVNKGPSALDIVKKKYKGQIMKVEELDLTKVAEAFGGHIVEQEQTEYQKQQEKQRQRRKKFGPENPTGKINPSSKEAGEKILKKIKSFSKKNKTFKKGETTGTPTPKRGSTTMRAPENPQLNLFTGKPEPPKEVPVKTTYEKKPKTEKPPETPLEKLIRQAQRKPRTIPFMDRKQLDTETQKKVDAVTPPFATKQGETGPLPVSMRNRRVPKTSSLSPNVNVTSVVKPTVGRIPLTQTDFNKIVPFRRGKPFTDFVTDVSDKTTVIPPDPKPEKGGEIGKDTGRVVDTTVVKPTEKEIKKLKPKKGTAYLPPVEDPEPKPPDTETERTPPTPPKPPKPTPGFGKFGEFRKFARRNAAVSLIGFDAAKNAADLAGKALNPANFGLRGGKVGRRSARQ